MYIFAWVRVRMCAWWVCVCIFLDVCMDMYIHIYIGHARTYICVLYIHTLHIHTHRHTHYTHEHKYPHQPCRQLWVCACMCMHVQTHTHIHTCCTDTLHVHPVRQNIPKFATATTLFCIRSMKHYVIHNIIILFLIIISSRSRICGLFFRFSIVHFVQVCFTPPPRHHARIQCVI